MENRLKLHDELEKLLGTKNVYFQPPISLEMKYPCIVYERSKVKSNRANNRIYASRKAYMVTVIAKDPDSDLIDKVVECFPYVDYNRHFTSDNLNHDVFTIYW